MKAFEKTILSICTLDLQQRFRRAKGIIGKENVHLMPMHLLLLAHTVAFLTKNFIKKIKIPFKTKFKSPTSQQPCLQKQNNNIA